MLFKSFAFVVTFLLLTIRITSARATGCFGDEQFTDLKKEGDITGTVEQFCNDKSGPQKVYNPGQVVEECYNFTDNSVNIKMDFGNYPNPPPNITISYDACKAVLNYVKQQCTVSGGNLLVSYVGGSLSHTLGASNRRNEKEQAVDGENRVSAVDDIEGDDQDNEHNQNVVYGVQEIATSTTISITTLTGTTQPPPGCPTVTVTSTYVRVATTGRKKHKTTETITETITTTATATTSSTETITLSASTSSSPTSPTPSSSSSTINTDFFQGWVKVDPQKLKCTSTTSTTR